MLCITLDFWADSEQLSYRANPTRRANAVKAPAAPPLTFIAAFPVEVAVEAVAESVPEAAELADVAEGDEPAEVEVPALAAA